VQNESGGLTPIAENQSLHETSYVYNEFLDLLDRGSSFVWKVEAQNQKGDGTIDRRGDEAEFHFTIDLPEVETIETKDPGILYGN
jgi:hypothetical protein